MTEENKVSRKRATMEAASEQRPRGGAAAGGRRQGGPWAGCVARPAPVGTEHRGQSRWVPGQEAFGREVVLRS